MTRLHFLNIEGSFGGGRAVRLLQRLQPRDGVLNVLSFRDLSFIDPFGLVLAAEYLRYLKLGLQQVALYLPQDTKVLHYLRRSRFLEFAATLGDVLPEHKALHAPQQEEEWLLPLTPLRREEEVPDLVGKLYSSLLVLVERSGTQSGVSAAQLSGMLAELCQNVTQHSLDLGLAAAQVYRSSGGEQRYLQLAVADLGIGLRGSLARRYQAEGWDDQEVIRQAMERGISAVPEVGRGLGLALVYQKTAEMQGRLLLRSGGVLLESSAGNDRFLETGYFPGTQIALEYR